MDGNDFDSNQLINLMKNLGAKNCDGFFVFYDYEDAEAFRIANLFNPGVIKEDTSTKAIVMVIDLMKVKYPIKSFDKMISMSHLIAEKIEAIICDEKMQPLSVQLIQHLQTKAQEVQQQVVGSLTPTFQKVLGELIAQKEYEMIVAPGALLYADPDLDITEEVIAYLDNALTEKSE